MGVADVPLRYGLNPHQVGGTATGTAGRLPVTVRNGTASYLKMLDALTGWQLVREAGGALGRPVAASIKHVSPNGVGLDRPLSDAEAAAFQAPDELSPIAVAYVRARGTDLVAGYGDMIALSETCDESLAAVVRRVVSNGIIAPEFTPAALKVLSDKQRGDYLVLQVDPAYDPPAMESREIFGVRLTQGRNDTVLTPGRLDDVVTRERELPPEVVEDLVLATAAVKYAPSNAICVAHRGQTVGIASGQPSRVQATRLARAKAEEWLLRQHPRTLSLDFGAGIGGHARATAVQQYLEWRRLGENGRRRLRRSATTWQPPLTTRERRDWLAATAGLALSSDGPFPFTDSLDELAELGVRYVVQPGGSARDAEVISRADEYGMTMAFTGVRLFQH